MKSRARNPFLTLVSIITLAIVLFTVSGCPQNPNIIDIFNGNAVWDESVFDSDCATFSD